MDQYDRDIDQAIRLANSHKKNGYLQMLENNVSTYGAKTIRAKREKKNKNKKTFSKNGVRSLLIAMIIINFMSTGIILENARYNKAVDFISSNLVAESAININGENIQEKMQSFINEMKSKGLSERSIMKYIQDIYGNDIFDIAVQTLGYKDGGDYMISAGYKHEVLSSSGETVYATYPKEVKYGIDSRHELVNKVNEIKENRKGR